MMSLDGDGSCLVTVEVAGRDVSSATGRYAIPMTAADFWFLGLVAGLAAGIPVGLCIDRILDHLTRDADARGH